MYEIMLKEIAVSLTISIRLLVAGFFLDLILFTLQPPFDHGAMMAGFIMTMGMLIAIQVMVLLMALVGFVLTGVIHSWRS